MIEVFKTYENGDFLKIDEPERDCWVSLTNPTAAELTMIAELSGVDADALRAPLDEEERARIETEDNYTLVLIDVPDYEKEMVGKEEKSRFITMPLAIISTKEMIISVCLRDTGILKQFKSGRVRDFYTFKKTRFILQILYRTATSFLQNLRIINRQSETIEDKLHVSQKNSELIELLELEKSLVYFTTSLRANEVVFEKLLRSEKVKQYPEDEDLMEDVIIENKQAMEMANTYSGILSGMMDAFASVISNNLNVVMKFLATVTIVLSIPTMIASFYGMNVKLPFQSSEYGFYFVTGGALLLTFIVVLIFRKKDLF